MTRQIVALLLGFVVLGLVTALVFSVKETEVQQATLDFCIGDCPADDLSSHIPITVDGNGAIRLDSRPVESAELTEEIAAIVARAAEAGEPVPEFSLATDPAVDNAAIDEVMEALVQGGAESISFDTTPAE